MVCQFECLYWCLIETLASNMSFPPIIVFELIETTWVMSFQIKKCYVFVVMSVHKLRIYYN